jgi:hypothetical protein
MGEGGGLLSSAEFSIKRALQIATTTKCVLSLSEYEKAVGGMRSSARTDGGATSRDAAPQSNRTAAPTPTVRPSVPAAPTPSAQPTADQLSLFG